MISCEVWILAGGLSSRMGKDKARLRLGGKSLLAHARAAARAAGLPVRVLRRDRVPRCGPLGGVCTALRATTCDAVLFLSCDMPFVDGPFLGRVLSKLTLGKAAVFAARQRAGFPFVIRRSALPQVEGLIAREEFSLQALSRQLRATWVRPAKAQERVTFNINTPAELETAQRLWRLTPRDEPRPSESLPLRSTR
jgi:molybdopterin-guanine dinucleotide biosynthesis protein A